MDRIDKILGFICDKAYVPMKAEELAVVLSVPKSDMAELLAILSQLESRGDIYKTKRGKYIAVKSDNGVAVGVLSCNFAKGFGFVRCDDANDNDIFIPAESMVNAYDRDRVLVAVNKSKTANGHREGRIIKVIERGNEHIVGVVKGIRGNKFVVTPDRREFFADVLVATDKMNGAKKDDRVFVNIDGYTDKNKPHGTVVYVLGNKNSILSCLNGMVSERSMTPDFPGDVVDEVNSIADTVSESEIEGREDLRNTITFTIDGDDSRDFDDAVSLEYSDNGNAILGVHIADVTHYVTENSALDKEALRRATSVYFPHMVIPMLPKKLSNGICSLNPDVDRLTLSVIMEFDGNANLVSHRIVKSVIHSNARLTYNNVNKLFDGNDEMCEKYADIADILRDMNTLAKKLERKRKARGAIDFDFPETKVICDENANPIDVALYERGDSQKLIESFMLAANETVAETAFWSELPFVYRVHESPSNEKLTEFNEFIKNFGYSLKGKIDSDTIHPKALQEISESVKGTAEEMMISKMMLRSLMKAVYRDSNDGHFGLAAKYYCHFTSPIRRYPDLMIHRILKEFIDGTLTDERRNHYLKVVKDAAAISSDKEIEAETAEREAVDMLKAAYMQNYVGESFDAVVSSVTSFGMFAMLDNSCEGLIRYETMSGDYFEFDELSRSVYGNRTGKVYKIGDPVRITVVAADILSRRIDFVREEDNIPQVLERVKKRNQSIKPKSHSKRRNRGKSHSVKRKHKRKTQ